MGSQSGVNLFHYLDSENLQFTERVEVPRSFTVENLKVSPDTVRLGFKGTDTSVFFFFFFDLRGLRTINLSELPNGESY